MKSEEIISNFLQFTNNLKLYHWNTSIYARHKASDKLLTKLNALIDLFVESYMGKYGKLSPIEDIKNLNVNDKNVKVKLINPFIKFLKQLTVSMSEDDELSHLCHEMLNYTEQTIYLFSLK